MLPQAPVTDVSATGKAPTMSLLSDIGHSHTGHSAPALPTDPATRCRCLLEFQPGSGGEAVVVCVSGEVDVFTRPILTRALIRAVSRNARRIVVDMAAMGFCCARGYDLIAQTAHVARGRGIEFAGSGLSVHRTAR